MIDTPSLANITNFIIPLAGANIAIHAANKVFGK